MLHTLEMAHSILDALPLGVFWKDKNSVYLGCNKWYADYAGIRPEDIAGKTDRDLCWSACADKYIHDDQELIESHKKFECVEKHIINHTEIWGKTTKLPLIVNNQIVGVLGFLEANIFDSLSEALSHASEIMNQINQKIDFGNRRTEDITIFKDRQAEDKITNKTNQGTNQIKDDQVFKNRQAEDKEIFKDRQAEDKLNQ